MKKETTTAIILGVSFGIIIALFLTLTTKEKMSKKNIITSKTTSALLTPQPKIQTLEIREPINGSVVDKNSIVIKGRAEKNSLIIIQSPTTEKAIKTTDNNFSCDFPLSLGENFIKITTYQPKNSDEKTLKIYYLKE